MILIYVTSFNFVSLSQMTYFKQLISIVTRPKQGGKCITVWIYSVISTCYFISKIGWNYLFMKWKYHISWLLNIRLYANYNETWTEEIMEIENVWAIFYISMVDRFINLKTVLSQCWQARPTTTDRRLTTTKLTLSSLASQRVQCVSPKVQFIFKRKTVFRQFFS